MLSTAFTRLVGCRVPIQLAALPDIGTPELAAAVADAGGLAMVGLPMLPPEGVAALLDAVAAKTRGAFGANFLMPFLDRPCVEIAAGKARVVEFFYGDPDPELIVAVHNAGALASWQVGSVAEAIAAERAGCDFVIAQGLEAGGHVRGTLALLPLLDQVLAAVQCPVVAAGGIATSRSLAAVLAAGAGAARIGTRFVAASESAAHPRYVELLLQAAGEDTVYTEAFSVMWPNAPHRVLRSCLDVASALEAEIVGQTPTPTGVMPLPRFAVVPPTRDTSGKIEAMALYAGQGVGAVSRMQPASEIMRELVEGAVALLTAF
jgi:NAD(P)H-dependent flavin oxidoreductase YrpB (nitropropane dioxygenase family)